MKIAALFSFLLLCLPILSNAEVGIFVKIAIDDTRYSSLLVHKPENLEGKFRFIARKIKDNTFNFTKIEKDFYQVNIRHGMTYMKTPMKVYELNPAFNDRFTHVLWVVDDLIIRREIYNLRKKLMSAYGYVDGLPEMVFMDKSKRMGNSEAYLKENFNMMKFDYKGFRIMSAKEEHDGIKHILFVDGLNKFSVFVQHMPDKEKKMKSSERILMGNNIMRKKINDELFTVVGTIPYKEMTDVVHFVETRKEEFLK